MGFFCVLPYFRYSTSRGTSVCSVTVYCTRLVHEELKYLSRKHCSLPNNRQMHTAYSQGIQALLTMAAVHMLLLIMTILPIQSRTHCFILHPFASYYIPPKKVVQQPLHHWDCCCSHLVCWIHRWYSDQFLKSKVTLTEPSYWLRHAAKNRLANSRVKCM